MFADGSQEGILPYWLGKGLDRLNIKAFYLIANISWIYIIQRASMVAHLVKSPPIMQEPPVQFLGQEDPLEKE